MVWKNWPYWLRGGIISIAIFIVLIVITLIGKDTGHPPAIIIPLLPGLMLITLFNASYKINDSIFVIELISVVVFFFIGTLIGLIIGKIKSRV